MFINRTYISFPLLHFLIQHRIRNKSCSFPSFEVPIGNNFKMLVLNTSLQCVIICILISVLLLTYKIEAVSTISSTSHSPRPGKIEHFWTCSRTCELKNWTAVWRLWRTCKMQNDGNIYSQLGMNIDWSL